MLHTRLLIWKPIGWIKCTIKLKHRNSVKARRIVGRNCVTQSDCRWLRNRSHVITINSNISCRRPCRSRRRRPVRRRSTRRRQLMSEERVVGDCHRWMLMQAAVAVGRCRSLRRPRHCLFPSHTVYLHVSLRSVNMGPLLGGRVKRCTPPSVRPSVRPYVRVPFFRFSRSTTAVKTFNLVETWR